jgi:hypothetical protein
MAMSTAMDKTNSQLNSLAQEGIACRVEGDRVVCTGQVLKQETKEASFDLKTFTPEKVKSVFVDEVDEI